MSSPISIKISPDGLFAYSANTNSHSISIYSIGSNSELIFIQIIFGGNSCHDIEISHDGNNLYSIGPGGIFTFNRDLSTGLLTEIHYNNLEFGTISIKISNDDKSIYITSHSILNQFSRNISTGLLTAYSIPSLPYSGYNISISSDDSFVYNCYGAPINLFSRDLSNSATHGQLTYIGPAITSSISSGGLTISILSIDGLFAYSIDNNNNSNVIYIFNRNSTTGIFSNESTSLINILDRTIDILVSPDNNYLYVLSGTLSLSENKIYCYSRNTATGLLTLLEIFNLVDMNSIQSHAYRFTISTDGLSIYVPNVYSSEIFQFNRDPITGLLSIKYNFTNNLETDAIGIANPVGLSLSPDNNYVYVANSQIGNISRFSRNSTTGALSFNETITPIVYDQYYGPILVDVSPDGNNLYSITQDSSILEFSRNISSGVLTPLQSQQTFGTFAYRPGEIQIHPTGNFVYVGTQTSSNVLQFSRDYYGALSQLSTSFIKSGIIDAGNFLIGDSYTIETLGTTDFTLLGAVSNTIGLTFISTGIGSGTGTVVRNGSNSYIIRISPDGLFAYVIDNYNYNVFGLLNESKIYQYQIVSGQFIPLSTRYVYCGNYPIDLIISPNGKFVYVTDNSNYNLFYLYVRDVVTGLLTPNTTVSVPLINAQNGYISPDNLNLYVSHDTNSIAQYSIDQTTGLLTFISNVFINLNSSYSVFSADGLFLYVGNGLDMQCSISIFSRNPSTGILTIIGDVLIGHRLHELKIIDNHLYALDTLRKLVLLFKINPSTGEITLLKEINIKTTGRFELFGRTAYITDLYNNQINQYHIT